MVSKLIGFGHYTLAPLPSNDTAYIAQATDIPQTVVLPSCAQKTKDGI